MSHQYVGDSRVLSLLALGMWGISWGFVQTKMATIVPARTSKYISAHWSGHECSQYLWNPFYCYSNQYID